MKNIFQRIVAFIVLILLSPLFLLLYVIVKATSRGPFIFKQKRTGKIKKTFLIYKIRTMIPDAEKIKTKIKQLNEADGPVFKVDNDPRYTKFGYLLAHSGLDELPQLWNIIKGDMAFIGPRPLPVDEAKKILKKYDRRFDVLPGISSPWVINGTDHSNFGNWMKLDLEYVANKNFLNDLKITLKTIVFLSILIFKSIRRAKA